MRKFTNKTNLLYTFSIIFFVIIILYLIYLNHLHIVKLRNNYSYLEKNIYSYLEKNIYKKYKNIESFASSKRSSGV